MTRQLRRRIMLSMMTLLSITFISIIAAINVWIRAGNQAEADNHLRFLMQREMEPDMPEPKEPPKPDNRRAEVATAHFILAKYTSDRHLLSIENSLSDSYSEEEIKQYCDEILEKDSPQGTIGQLRYTLRRDDNGITIAFIDHSAAKKNAGNLLLISLVLGVTGLIMFALLSYRLSGLMVRPVEEAFQKQKQFISDASHELKTPITVILSNSELLGDEIGENRRLSYIQQECDRMNHLVASLLTLTRLEQTPYESVEKNRFSLSDALWERILPLESIAFEKGITMQENIAPDILLYGVKEQLQQVAAIFMDNAFSHTAKQGIINISLEETPHHIVFTVSNTGDPVPEEEQDKLFERFYRSDKARNRAGGHYGLGLSIAKTIVTNHKGRIHIECRDGMTSFIATFKRTEK
ncbi:MAG: HAMP domain-containing histidine kinase [Bacteroidales bacterium]|nr:HAMP domain-containing histidine kinase [Clostridium sp.]MCM1203243.1 HAMP domain-containing histidine kinase [Bacteroidales bacterium]